MEFRRASKVDLQQWECPIPHLWTRSNDDKKESKKILKLPVIDFNVYLNKDSSDAAREAFQKECSKVSSALHEYG